MKTIYCQTKQLVKLKILFAMLGIFLMTMPAMAQDPEYSMWTVNPTYYNPSYVGLAQGMRARFTYRKQWVKLPADFRTFNFNADLAAREAPGSGGIGLIVDSDNEGEGIIKRNMAGITLAVRVPVASSIVTQFGILSSVIQKKIDWSRFVFTDQLDEVYGNIYPTSFEHPADETVVIPDFGAGALMRFVANTWKHKELVGTLGLAVHHIFEPNEAFLGEVSRLPRKYVVSFDVMVQDMQGKGPNRLFKSTKKGFRFNPGFIYQYQGGMSSYQLGINMYKHPLYLGIWYRNDEFKFMDYDAIVAMVGINIDFDDLNRMKLFYSYDLQLTDLMRATGGTHELVLLFEFDAMRLFGGGDSKKYNRAGNYTARRRHTMPKALECPSF